jgi:hypothetical protein
VKEEEEEEEEEEERTRMRGTWRAQHDRKGLQCG